MLLLGLAGGHYARGLLAQRAARAEFERLAASAGPPATRGRGENPGIVQASSRGISAEALDTGRPLARIRIPSAQIDYIVLEGSDAETLEKGPGHVPGTALPGIDGPPGNCVITAHRDSHFRRLGWVREGHRVEIETPSGHRTYRVVSREIVKPDAVRVLEPTPEPRLTLITCYPFDFIGPAPRRLVLVAEPLS